MRAIWTGTIAFGLVNIPVKLFSAISEKGLDLDMLDKKDLAHIQYKRVNSATGKEVPWKQIVKGFEIKGKYVVLTDEDFEKASPEKTKMIELELFTKTTDIDVILFDSAYYLMPTEAGRHAFSLLQEALAHSGMAAVGSFVLRNKQRPVVLRATGKLLILHTLRFIHEIKDPAPFTVQAKDASKKELAMASGLIKSLTSSFNIHEFKDTYTEKLLKLIKAKASGKKLPTAYPKVTETHSDNLLTQLAQSLKLNSATKSSSKPSKSSSSKSTKALKESTENKKPASSKKAAKKTVKKALKKGTKDKQATKKAAAKKKKTA